MFPCSIEIRDKMSAAGQVVSHLGEQSATFHIFSNGHLDKTSNLLGSCDGRRHGTIFSIKFAQPLHQDRWI
jgi:hypothetical protein